MQVFSRLGMSFQSKVLVSATNRLSDQIATTSSDERPFAQPSPPDRRVPALRKFVPWAPSQTCQSLALQRTGRDGLFLGKTRTGLHGTAPSLEPLCQDKMETKLTVASRIEGRSSYSRFWPIISRSREAVSCTCMTNCNDLLTGTTMTSKSTSTGTT